MSDTINLPVRVDSGWKGLTPFCHIVMADGATLCAGMRYPEDMLEIARRINLAPALAALEAVAEENKDYMELQVMLARASGNFGQQCVVEGMLDRIKAALALAGATLDGKDAKP